MDIAKRLQRIADGIQRAAETRGDKCPVKALIIFRPAEWRDGAGVGDKTGVMYHAADGKMRVEIIAALDFRPLCPQCGRKIPVLELTDAELHYWEPDAIQWPEEMKSLADSYSSRL